MRKLKPIDNPNRMRAWFVLYLRAITPC